MLQKRLLQPARRSLATLPYVSLCVVLCVTLLTGCVAVDGQPLGSVLSPAPAGAAAPSTRDAAAPAIEPPFSVQPMRDGPALSAREVFDQVSPAVAFVETSSGTGSGVLIAPGYLVTNAHVVWPFPKVRVVFPDGSEFIDVEVIGWDLVADLAVLGPIETDIAPQQFVDGLGLPMGSDVYLIGYPGELDSFPQPTITQGILSRMRTWETVGLRLFQVDADTTGGQSGGVLISEQGEIIGITTYNFSGAQYALVSAAVDNVPRLNALVTGESTAFAERRPFGQEAQLTFDARLPGQFSTDIYVLDVAPREEVELEVEGNGRPQISVTSAVGWQVAASEPSLNRVQRVRFTAKEDEGPYFVTISHLSRFRNDYTLTSSHPLSALNDPDDQQRFTDQAFTSGESYWGSMDAPGDLDIYPLKLEKGQEVVVEVDAMGVQPYIRLLVETQAQNALYIQADGGEDGVFGEKAQLVFAAPQTGTYRFLVDSSGYDVGGYRISVRAATDDDTLTEAVNESEFYFSRYGLQEQYESDANPFIIRYPARWQSTACNQNATACFSGGDVGALIIAEENLAASGVLRGDATLADYVDLLEEMLTANPTVIEMVQRGDFTTQSGLTGELLVSVLPGNRLEMLRFVYVEDEVAFNATYIYPQRLSETWRDIFEFQLTSFRIGDEELEEGSARYYVEEAQQHYLRRDYAAALSALDKAIELDDTLADAFFTRALVRQQRGELDAAIADQLRLIELDPDHAPNFSQLAQLYWQAGQTEEAVAASDKVLELEPEQPGEHNNRALFYATLNDSERALAETVSYAELLDDELPPHALDTRAYIYLKEDRLEEAQADYVAALEEDFQSPYTLLGAGVTAARLGDGARAVDLIEYGFELLAEQDSLWAQHLTPQLQDLVEWADAVLAQNGR